MPRPKRPKMVHTVPTLRGANPAAAPSANKQAKYVSPASSGRVTNPTDDSDGIVTTKKPNHASRRPVAREEFTMTGGLGGEEETTRLRPPTTRTIEEVTRIAREAEYASIAADRKRAREIAARQSSESTQIPSSLPRQAAARGGRTGSRVSSSALNSKRPSIVSKGQQTPPGRLSLGPAMFKKRPRQPSLLQITTSQTGQSELDNDDDGDLDDFRPDDESTPLVKSLSQSRALGASSSSHQASSGSRKRKLTSPEVQVPASQSEATIGSPSEVLSQPMAQDDNSQLGQSEEGEEYAESPEPALPSHYTSQTPAPEIFSDTLAPPQSSSSPPAKADRRTSRKAAAQAAPMAKTVSRNQTRAQPTIRPPKSTTSATAAPIRQPLKPLTTATLQNLLPRRHTRHRAPKGAYDFPSSSDAELDTTALGEDEDELSFHTAKTRRKTKTPARTTPSVKKGGGKATAKQHETPAAGEKGKRLSKTYTRKSLVESDVESGEEDEEDDSLMPVKTKGKGKGDEKFDLKAKKEMERLSKKFAEVDEYALDFEDFTGSSSQMLDAR